MQADNVEECAAAAATATADDDDDDVGWSGRLLVDDNTNRRLTLELCAVKVILISCVAFTVVMASDVDLKFRLR